ncbi:AAA family ATPase [Candidatus Bipolaricaulota bacterium]|nr:AAA family ATPase [Candidatus Bipolaricaulota bacterium]
MTPEFSRVFGLMENSGERLFITGKAGTGKSTLLQYFKGKTRKRIVVVAPTGVAAINVGGSTIHSFFQFPSGLVKQEDVRVIANKHDLFRSLDAIVIDEVSMVRADLMDAIDRSLRINRNRLDEPFGGVQAILIGDLYQLPPVVESELTEYFANTYESPFFFSANVFKQVPLSIVELQRVFRQTDPQFIAFLNKIRTRQVTAEELQVLNERLNHTGAFGKYELAINLTSTKKLASRINQDELNSLPLHEYSFNAVIMGKFDEKSHPTDKRLRLKEGAQVMMVKNDSDKRWVNGSLGIIKNISQRSIRVSLGRASYQVGPVTWEKTDYEYNREEGKIESVVIGSFRQYPIKLAWAITIHKSQGKTFEKEIIDLGNGAFAHGQAYVALSRCRSFQGIQLKTPIKLSDIILDEQVVDFLSRGNGV